MCAAQNQVLPVAGFAVDLPTLPAGVVELLVDLPTPIKDTVVILIVATFCAPRLLRTLDDHLFNRRARQKITRSADWVEIVRIRSESRQAGRRRRPPPRIERRKGVGKTSGNSGDDQDIGGIPDDQPP